MFLVSFLTGKVEKQKNLLPGQVWALLEWIKATWSCLLRSAACIFCLLSLRLAVRPERARLTCSLFSVFRRSILAKSPLSVSPVVHLALALLPMRGRMTTLLPRRIG